MNTPLTLALPKGRLFKQVQADFAQRGMEFSFNDRKLVAYDSSGMLKIMLVKNSDMPTYIHHGIAGLGICGDDVIYESGYSFTELLTLPYGGTRICLAGRKEDVGKPLPSVGMTIASKFTHFTRDHFHDRGIPAKVIKLNGSVELAPILGLAPYIVDLVETGSTLKANNLEVIEKLKDIKVRFFANPAYFKVHYDQIRQLVEQLKKEA